MKDRNFNQLLNLPDSPFYTLPNRGKSLSINPGTEQDEALLPEETETSVEPGPVDLDSLEFGKT